MENFEGVFDLTAIAAGPGERDKEVTEIYKGERRRLLAVSLRNNAVLTKHKADEPITVQCIAGSGQFLAGPGLEDRIQMTPGVLVTLAPGVEHEAAAEPELYLLVTKFTA